MNTKPTPVTLAEARALARPPSPARLSSGARKARPPSPPSPAAIGVERRKLTVQYRQERQAARPTPAPPSPSRT
jgi:hypothetical protein